VVTGDKVVIEIALKKQARHHRHHCHHLFPPNVYRDAKWVDRENIFSLG
jgi:hypothetical protein